MQTMKTVTHPSGKPITRSPAIHLLSVALCAAFLTACGGGGGGGGGSSSGTSGGGGTPGPITTTGTVSTIAGSGISGFNDAAGKFAMFDFPLGIAADAAGSIYVADNSNQRIRKMTSGGAVSTVAGNSSQGHNNAAGTLASFYSPSGVAVDGFGNAYVADSVNHSIRKIVLGTNMVSTFAGDGTYTSGLTDGKRTSAKFKLPMGVAVDAAGNVYVADSGNNVIRKIDVNTGDVTTLAGNGNFDSVNGPLGAASFANPTDLAVNAAGTLVYVVEPSKHLVRKIDVTAGTVSTLVGTGYTSVDPNKNCKGVGTAVTLGVPQNIAMDVAGNVYVATTSDHSICKITAGGVAAKIAGTGTNGNKDGAASQATFNQPHGMAFDAAGNLFIADTGNNTIRKITF